MEVDSVQNFFCGGVTNEAESDAHNFVGEP